MVDVFSDRQVEAYSPGGFVVDIQALSRVLASCKDIVDNDMMLNDVEADTKLWHEKQAIVACQALANEVLELRKIK